MYQPISYGKLLLYHFLVGVIALGVNILILGAAIVQLFIRYDVLLSDSTDFGLQLDFFIDLIVIMIVMGLITSCLTAGLSYIPYLYKTNNLNLKSIYRVGFKNVFAVLLYNLIINVSTLFIVVLFVFIPLVGGFLVLGITYFLGLIYFFIDYHLSRNALHGQKMFAYFSFNWSQFFSHSNRGRDIYLAPLYYFLVNLVGFANLFIKPLFHYRTIQMLSDEEQIFSVPPSAPPMPPYIGPPHSNM